MNFRDLISGITFLTCGVIATLVGKDFYADSAYVPMGVGVLMCLFAIPVIWRGAISVIRYETRTGLTSQPMVIDPARFGITLICCVIYYIALPVVGFYTSSTLFICILAFLLGERRPTIIIFIALSFIALLYGLFALVLKRSLPVEFFLAS
ncbi:tripartite tricarboxylate transporter TctB family protein [Vreelandella olivaria]|uniref:tripartite tricarboxylate transporter TctB family protein n=1 Tax=Vreelandella olivaria TaxID=390919 RepID=UPI00201F234D|nr:tripartite tricarboxylate transporter TctB family protein [Halomonas olivaria]